MAVDRRREAEQPLQQTMNGGRLEQILSPHHMRHALQRQAEPKQPAAAPTKVASAKRVVQPAEPVLASSAPDLTKTTLEPTAAPEPAAGGQVASRIAASFDSFGSAAFASAGDSHQLGLASAYSSFR
ncbi:hypothetical protein ACIKT0_03305 [Hansschlegelia beijingensis]|uniref:hypothetical protein n=1 Tax=Hansschlegelia beijingensis TaxID=1133344 RepID=UPI00387F1753